MTGLHLGPGLLRTSFGIWIHEMYMKQLNCCSWREVYCNSQGPHSSLLLLPLNLCEFTHLSHLFSRKKNAWSLYTVYDYSQIFLPLQLHAVIIRLKTITVCSYVGRFYYIDCNKEFQFCCDLTEPSKYRFEADSS